MTWFQRLLVLTLLATFVLVAIGGTVRATDSGLGCPDWPTCHGELIPKAEKHTLIEFSHRTAAAVVGVIFLGVTFFAFRTERRNTLVFWLAFTAGVLLAWQIVLGGITVKRDLPSEIVAAHLATAMAFMGVLIVTLTVSIMRKRGTPVSPSSGTTSFARMAIATAAVTFVTLVLGSYISGSDAALACSGWPLCNGTLVPGGESAVGLHYLHRLVAGVLGLMTLALIYLAFEERRRQPLLLALAVAAGASFVVQALVGAANIWTQLADPVVVVHLVLGALLWCMLVTLSALAYYLPGEAAEQADARAAGGARKAAEWAR